MQSFTLQAYNSGQTADDRSSAQTEHSPSYDGIESTQKEASCHWLVCMITVVCIRSDSTRLVPVGKSAAARGSYGLVPLQQFAAQVAGSLSAYWIGGLGEYGDMDWRHLAHADTSRILNEPASVLSMNTAIWH